MRVSFTRFRSQQFLFYIGEGSRNTDPHIGYLRGKEPQSGRIAKQTIPVVSGIVVIKGRWKTVRPDGTTFEYGPNEGSYLIQDRPIEAYQYSHIALEDNSEYLCVTPRNMDIEWNREVLTGTADESITLPATDKKQTLFLMTGKLEVNGSPFVAPLPLRITEGKETSIKYLEDSSILYIIES